MEGATYEDAVQAGRELIVHGDGDNHEYNRGVVNLIADLWGKAEMDTSDRMVEVARDMGVKLS